ncbi:malate synthase G [Texcoconibacillus texcoconensis]|uniref:Malate synthase G n=1 Tax=Texcoconibacillus texcoconensis TaxID=1095777 RepID=A0A840QPU3_9BACI|nr:malate synthase G [Texcoconibacillus texcoconensis]MBB5173379.1 malate synthase [Texcoconibacillus texcoconensis]
MSQYIKIGKLQVAEGLHRLIEQEVLPGTDVDKQQYWDGFERILTELTPENRSLLKQREEIQQKMDEWHQQNEGIGEREAYRSFLKEIGYLEPEQSDFHVETTRLDDEIAVQAGPQLVVPANNARYALNAANARWGSLYDALYGTDVIDETDGATKGTSYNPVRGEKVIARSKQFVDSIAPLERASHEQVTSYRIDEEGQLIATTSDGTETPLRHPGSFAGYQGKPSEPTSILLKHQNLHVDIQIDRDHPIGKSDKAGVKDIEVEAAVSTIIDFEDSVTAVDAEDKVDVYRHWIGLMKGTLSTKVSKGDKTIERTLNPDRQYVSPKGESFELQGRSLMLVRNVGHLMTTDLVLDESGQEMPEGIVDTLVSSLIAKHDLLGNGKYRNSRKGSIYIVKPKMHGSKEVAFANRLFAEVEKMLGMSPNTLKMGVMDEERRTSLNLKNAIRAVKERIFFINTGFLDRTGDEIHTSFYAGPMIRKGEMKTSAWLNAYEDSNVTYGLATRLGDVGQIGKGMWPMPDEMKAMIDNKESQLTAGGNTAWVPSPTAATLHALHYHNINVDSVQHHLRNELESRFDELLDIPVEANPSWSQKEIQEELETNAQSILGYVVRWVEHGVGCSKVPNLQDIGLMEDRATLRISSQHMANWLYHGICTEDEVITTMKKMARVVDKQNADDPNYTSMSDDFENSTGFQAALDLVLKGKEQPNGYTEPVLHEKRQEHKSKAKANI